MGHAVGRPVQLVIGEFSPIGFNGKAAGVRGYDLIEALRDRLFDLFLFEFDEGIGRTDTARLPRLL
jgi:hypothetical protein